MDPNTTQIESEPAVPAGRPADAILSRLIAVVRDTVQDWDVPSDIGITASTKLAQDLGCSSVDIIGIVVAIEEEFGTRNLGFAQVLFRDNRYVDVSLGDLARFVADKLGTHAS